MATKNCRKAALSGGAEAKYHQSREVSFMRAASVSRTTIATDRVTLLENGDRMNQAEFHRRYLESPEDEKWELVGGTVYRASPLSLTLSDYDEQIGFALGLYRRSTPGVQVLHGATAILGEESEPQPDLGLRILPEYGGQSRSVDDYVQGPPELLVEIAHSTRALDMHQKRADYERAGIVEYLVICTEERELHWFNFRTASPLRPDRAGVYRSRVFPGLWIDGQALLDLESARLAEVVRQGIATPAHASLIRRLERARRRSGPARGQP
jgi:Uma2 family endonuclease